MALIWKLVQTGFSGTQGQSKVAASVKSAPVPKIVNLEGALALSINQE